jgi:acetylornithine deacetylase
MNMMDSVSILQSLIKIPSFSREESAVADFLEEKMKSLFNAEIHRYKNNLWVVSPTYDAQKPTLLLAAHLDTVKPTGNWTKDPFSATVEDNTLFGLGSNDDGINVVVFLSVFEKLMKSPQTYNFVLALTAEEEVSGKDGIEALLPKLPKIDFAIVGEPTNLNLAMAEKGLMVLDVVAKGRSGHAARNEGENAIYKAVRAIDWFQNYRFDKTSEFLGDVKMTVTQINAGTQHNLVPDKCSFVVDIRSNELYSNQEILDIVKTNMVDCEVMARSTRLNSTFTPQNELVKKAICLGANTFGSPTLSDQALLTFPSVKIGAGDSARSHTADEYILIPEIEKGIDFFVEWLNGAEVEFL